MIIYAKIDTDEKSIFVSSDDENDITMEWEDVGFDAMDFEFIINEFRKENKK